MKKKKNKNLTKITNEAIIVMIIIRTNRTGNNRKTRHTEKKNNSCTKNISISEKIILIVIKIIIRVSIMERMIVKQWN